MSSNLEPPIYCKHSEVGEVLGPYSEGDYCRQVVKGKIPSETLLSVSPDGPWYEESKLNTGEDHADSIDPFYWLRVNGVARGPFRRSALRDLLRQGKIVFADRVATKQAGPWTSVRSLRPKGMRKLIEDTAMVLGLIGLCLSVIVGVPIFGLMVASEWSLRNREPTRVPGWERFVDKETVVAGEPQGEPIGSDVSVRGTLNPDGTYKRRPHFRTYPDGEKGNNYSTKGNVNPYTGEAGQRKP